MAQVYSKRARQAPKNAVYVGRPTRWGNPFSVETHGRDNAIELYREWIYSDEQADIRQAMRDELRGKNLVCWCAPEPCHADIILEIANG